MLRFRYKMRPRKFSSTLGVGSGQEGRIKRMRMLVTELVRYERIESTYEKCDEARGYAERLIQVAAKHGDRHPDTMEMADYWLLEKDLVHKLFKVLVPRFQQTSTALTDVYRLPSEYPGRGNQRAVLELKGHPWPPVQPREWERKHFFSNMLLAELRNEKVTAGKSASSTAQSDEGSSVDPPVSSQHPQPSSSH